MQFLWLVDMITIATAPVNVCPWNSSPCNCCGSMVKLITAILWDILSHLKWKRLEYAMILQVIPRDLLAPQDAQFPGIHLKLGSFVTFPQLCWPLWSADCQSGCGCECSFQEDQASKNHLSRPCRVEATPKMSEETVPSPKDYSSLPPILITSFPCYPPPSGLH